MTDAPHPAAAPCHVCSRMDVTVLDGGARLTLVSSDARPASGQVTFAVCNTCGTIQKIVDADWQTVVDSVYKSYDINYQSQGAEPTLFGSRFGTGPRSEVLLRFFQQESGVAAHGKLLDVGCSNGNLLGSFHKMFPHWGLHGSEISRQWEKTVLAIPGVERFFAGRDVVYSERYDVISLSHVLEHVPNPSGFLADLAKNLTAGGRFLIAVPDIRQNPIDLVIADHCTHFDINTLASVLTSAGLAIDVLADDALPKELIAVARVGIVAPKSRRVYRSTPAELCGGYFRLLSAVLAGARDARARSQSFGIMGSSIAAVWLASAMRPDVDFFVDEDPNRIGGSLLGAPIFALDGIPAGSTVYIPMSVTVATRIIERARGFSVRFEYLDWNRLDAD